MELEVNKRKEKKTIVDETLWPKQTPWCLPTINLMIASWHQLVKQHRRNLLAISRNRMLPVSWRECEFQQVVPGQAQRGTRSDNLLQNSEAESETLFFQEPIVGFIKEYCGISSRGLLGFSRNPFSMILAKVPSRIHTQYVRYNYLVIFNENLAENCAIFKMFLFGFQQEFFRDSSRISLGIHPAITSEVAWGFSSVFLQKFILYFSINSIPESLWDLSRNFKCFFQEIIARFFQKFLSEFLQEFPPEIL